MRCTIPLMIAAMLAAGCGSPLDDRLYDRAAAPAAWGGTSGGAAAGPGPTATQPSALDVLPSGPQPLVDLAMARNPRVLAAERRVQRLRARVPQATSLDDPVLQVAPIGEMAETAAGEVRVMTGLSQKLPFPGKRSARGAVAAAEADAAEAALAEVRLEVAAQVRRAYWSRYDAVRAVEVTERSQALLRQLYDAVEARYRAAAVPQAQLLRVGVELDSLQTELLTLRQRRATAAARLNALLNRAPTAPLPEVEPVQLAAVDLRLERWLRAAATHPAVERWRAESAAYRHRLRLARLDRWPDFTLSGNYNAVDDDGLAASANGDDQWWIGVGVTLPIWQGKRRAAIREAVRGMGEAAAELTAAENELTYQVQDALARIESQHEAARLLRDDILPKARQTVDVSLTGYRSGEVDFLDLLDNWQALLRFERLYHQNVAQLEQALADLQRAVGERPAEPSAGEGDDDASR